MHNKVHLILYLVSRAENNGQQVAGHDDQPNIF